MRGQTKGRQHWESLCNRNAFSQRLLDLGHSLLQKRPGKAIANAEETILISSAGVACRLAHPVLRGFTQNTAGNFQRCYKCLYLVG